MAKCCNLGSFDQIQVKMIRLDEEKRGIQLKYQMDGQTPLPNSNVAADYLSCQLRNISAADR